MRTHNVYMFFFFNDTATTEIYTLSLHDALPICDGPLRWPRLAPGCGRPLFRPRADPPESRRPRAGPDRPARRSEEHTSELQSRQYLVCRLLLEKKKITPLTSIHHTYLYFSSCLN